MTAMSGCSSSNDSANNTAINRPVPNPFLSSSVYGMTHFDSSQSDSTPYGPPRGFYDVDTTSRPIAYGGPTNIITLDSTNKDYMWAFGTDRVGYVYKGAGNWHTVARYEAMADASSNTMPAIPDDNYRLFGEMTAVGLTTTTMDTFLQTFFGASYASYYGNGTYVLVDKDNVAYANYGTNLYAFALNDPADPAAGMKVLYKMTDVITTIQAGYPTPPQDTRLSGISMTYDGHLVVTFSNGVAVIDRDLNTANIHFYRFADTEIVTNSIAVDEKNGIYVASGPNLGVVSSGTMRKLVWTGSTISDKDADGAWSSPYDSSAPDLPPIIKIGYGTGSTPTLMGFGTDPDRLVVITDGSKQMKLVAFWRDKIPAGFVDRIAGQIQVKCGFTTLPTWLQSEQSVVVYGYGAFVVNNIPETYSSQIVSASKILQVSLMGPAEPTSYGVERFQWNPSTHSWSSVWGRSDVSSTSMVPIHSVSGNMAVINGYRPEYGWEVLGLDWDNGSIVHQTVFGDENFGNGAYAILQYLDNGDLLFNSIAGPFRVHYGN